MDLVDLFECAVIGAAFIFVFLVIRHAWENRD